MIGRVAPGVFSANADGQGVAAAIILRVKADGSQTYEHVAGFDPTQNRFITAAIDFGPETDQLFLILFGTGIRNHGSLSGVRAIIGGTQAEVLYAGAQGDFVGLDQVNIRLQRNLAGRGETDVALTVDDIKSNTVRIRFK